jgi:hypothetical protein
MASLKSAEMALFQSAVNTLMATIVDMALRAKDRRCCKGWLCAASAVNA